MCIINRVKVMGSFMNAKLGKRAKELMKDETGAMSLVTILLIAGLVIATVAFMPTLTNWFTTFVSSVLDWFTDQKDNVLV